MTAMLKEAFQAATSVAAYVGIHHYVPIQNYWEPAPYGINFTEASRIPTRIHGERDEDLLEKHALLDSMLEKRVWGENYVVNPFPYIEQDLTRIGDRDLKAMQECFLFHYKKYESFKKMNEKVQIPSYQERRIMLMTDERGKEELQLKLELDHQIIGEKVLKEQANIPKLELSHYFKTPQKKQYPN